jgi:hypothetical protein
MILRSFSSNHHPGDPFRAAIQPEEAETSRNSLPWTTLQGTPLF